MSLPRDRLRSQSEGFANWWSSIAKRRGLLKRPPVIPFGIRSRRVRPRKGFRRINCSSGSDTRTWTPRKSISIWGNRTPERSCRTRVYDEK